MDPGSAVGQVKVEIRNTSSANSPTLQPLVPPKKELGYNQAAIEGKSNQSLETDDGSRSPSSSSLEEGSGDNLPFLILESLLDQLVFGDAEEEEKVSYDDIGDGDSRHKNTLDWNQKVSRQEELETPPMSESVEIAATQHQDKDTASKKLESNDALQLEAINQSPAALETPDFDLQPPSNNSESNIIDVTLQASQCPFSKLHYRNPFEYLTLDDKDNEEESNRYLRIDDLSSKLDHRIKFIIENLKDCRGIWPLLFIEKFNRICIRGDVSALQLCFTENFSLIQTLVNLYKDEKRCNVVFRYWCAFYNIMSRNLVEIQKLVTSDMFRLLKRDFLLASEGKCRCAENPSKASSTTTAAMDKEHAEMTPSMRMDIISILMIPLLTSDAFAPVCFYYDQVEECDLIANILRIICNGHLERDDSTTKGLKVDTIWNSEIGTNMLTHLLITLNLRYPHSATCSNPLVETTQELIVNENLDISLFMSKLMTIFLQEVRILQKGYLDGIRSILPVPLGVQLVGVNGPFKALINFLSLDTLDPFPTEDLKLMLNIASQVEYIACNFEIKDCRTDEIKVNARELQQLIQRKLPLEVQEGIDFNPCPETARKLHKLMARHVSHPADPDGLFLELSDDEKLTVKSKSSSNDDSHSVVKTVAVNKKHGGIPRIVVWPIDIMLKWFGCKKANTVSPATISDISYMDLLR